MLLIIKIIVSVSALTGFLIDLIKLVYSIPGCYVRHVNIRNNEMFEQVK